MSVNLSGHDLLDSNLPGFITETLKDHDLDPRYLMLEITEQALVHDFDRATAVLKELHDLGIRIAIDDFGTGHSSFAKIKHLPIDELKVDRSFVKTLPDDDKDVAIVQAAIGLAHSLGIEVLAEGVEERAAMEWLTEHGCGARPGVPDQPAHARGNIQPMGESLRRRSRDYGHRILAAPVVRLVFRHPTAMRQPL